MNFPMEYPIFQFFYWLVNTPGLGGIIAALVAVGCLLAYALTLRWIQSASQADEGEAYAYPTPTLHHGNSE